METQSQRSSVESTLPIFKSYENQTTIMCYRDYLNFLGDWDKSKSLYIFYTGTKSPNSGYYWCPTAMEALQIVEQFLGDSKQNMFLTVHVGTQDEWQDKNNPYKIDKDTKLRVIPTILKYQTNKRLEGQYCLKTELLDLLFEDECESDNN